MKHISNIIKKVNDDLFPEFEAKMRLELEKKDKDWLIDQIIFLTCEKHSLHEQKDRLEHMKERLTRIRTTGYNDQSIQEFIDTYLKTNRETLEKSGFLINPPRQGFDIIAPYQRSQKGTMLLEKAQDIFYAALYGDTDINVRLKREKEEILTIILPQSKSDTLGFLKAVTEINMDGTWKDPDSIANDNEAHNTGLQIEFCDTKNGTTGIAIFTALNLINLLQVNEQILYARMEKVGRSSLHLYS